MTLPWTTSELSASGQVFEFRLWAALTEQSRGQLHVFLPLTDRGIDGLVHRRVDGTYLPIQAKGRSSLDGGEVHLVVWADSLKDDKALLVSGLITDGGLGPTMLVVPEGDFKRLAIKSTNDGRPIYAMGFGMHPTAASRWFPFLVATERLAERFGVSLPAIGLEEAVPHPMWRSDVGFLGEAGSRPRDLRAGGLRHREPARSGDSGQDAGSRCRQPGGNRERAGVELSVITYYLFRGARVAQRCSAIPR
jgi:hypothetical protein